MIPGLELSGEPGDVFRVFRIAGDVDAFVEIGRIVVELYVDQVSGEFLVNR